MSYRITLDPADPSIARISRRVLRAVPFYAPLATVSRGSSLAAISDAAEMVAADQAERRARRAAAALWIRFFSGLFGSR